jgi:hypothetical protein
MNLLLMIVFHMRFDLKSFLIGRGKTLFIELKGIHCENNEEVSH